MTESEFDLFCVGNAIVDVFVKDAEQVHLSYGLTEPVQHVEIELIEKIISRFDEKTVVSGGGAANVAKIAAFIGAKTCFAGSIGSDNFGKLFEKDLTEAGVKLKTHRKTLPTGICLILRTNGESRIAASPSASLELSENDINGEDIKRAKLIVIDGFMLERRSLIGHILRLAALREKPVAIDLSSPYLAAKMAKTIEEYCGQYRVILFMNEDEAKAFYKSLNPDGGQGINSFFKSFTARGAWPVVVVKQGSRGAVCFAGGEMRQSETAALTPVDATSAGDAFGAGFLTAWAKGKPLAECAALGNKTAALVLGMEGSQVKKSSGPEEPLFAK